jgi:beta-1,4-mannosyltransferase
MHSSQGRDSAPLATEPPRGPRVSTDTLRVSDDDATTLVAGLTAVTGSGSGRRAAAPGTSVELLSSPGPNNPGPNPFNRLLLDALPASVHVQDFSRRRWLSGAHDILHIHWPEGLLDSETTGRVWLRSGAFLAALGAARMRGQVLVWTAHNATPHERLPLPARAAFAAWTRSVDGVIALSAEAMPVLHHAESLVIPHGHYRPVVKEHLGSTAAITPTGRLLFFGHIRRYKQVHTLIDAVAAAPGVRLRVVGSPWDADYSASLRDQAQDEPRIDVDLGFLEESELYTEIALSSGIVLPYSDMANSGAALLALSVGRPVLVPATPSTEELRDEVGAAWVHLFEGEITTQAVAAFAAAGVPDGEPDLEAREWSHVSELHDGFYRQLLAGRRGRLRRRVNRLVRRAPSVL